MIRRRALALCVLTSVLLVACEGDLHRATGPRGSDAFARFVSIGTSISMGVQSAGVLYSTQARAWPALLADQSFARFSYPAIQGPGCAPPLIAPLQFSRRLSGVAASSPDTSCAPLFIGTTVPANNVAVDGARTAQARSARAGDFPAGSFRRQLYTRVLGEGHTQVTAMMAQNPTLVSVELGANEVLQAVTSGLVIPGATLVSFAQWDPEYTAVIDSVTRTGARALLATVPEVTSIVSLRPAAAIWAVRQQFQAFNVEVNTNCETSPNLVFTAALVPRKVAEGQALAAIGQSAQLSCANVPGGTPDFILTPEEAAIVTATVNEMNDRIEALAAERGYALLDANEVLGVIVEERPAFNLVQLLSCTYPYGRYISLDGVHPNGDGHQLIANAAAEALNRQYGWSLPTVALAPIPQLCP